MTKMADNLIIKPNKRDMKVIKERGRKMEAMRKQKIDLMSYRERLDHGMSRQDMELATGTENW